MCGVTEQSQASAAGFPQDYFGGASSSTDMAEGPMRPIASKQSSRVSESKFSGCGGARPSQRWDSEVSPEDRQSMGGFQLVRIQRMSAVSSPRSLEPVHEDPAPGAMDQIRASARDAAGAISEGWQGFFGQVFGGFAQGCERRAAPEPTMEFERPKPAQPMDQELGVDSTTEAWDSVFQSLEERESNKGLSPVPATDVLEFSPASSPAPAPKKKTGRRPGDTASTLSMSSQMTSSAAALLGGMQMPGKPAAAKRLDSENRSQLQPADGTSDVPKPAGGRKSASVISGMNSSSSKSGQLLAGLVQPGCKAVGGKAGSQSVIVGKSANSSGAAQALSGLGSAKADGGSVSGAAKAPKGKSGASKSVISGLNTTNSQASALLAGMVQNKGQKAK